jgi:hypothetical protein
MQERNPAHSAAHKGTGDALVFISFSALLCNIVFFLPLLLLWCTSLAALSALIVDKAIGESAHQFVVRSTENGKIHFNLSGSSFIQTSDEITRNYFSLTVCISAFFGGILFIMNLLLPI